MVLQEDFAVEQFMDQYETNIDYNIAETCCESISINDLIDLVGSTAEEKSQLIDSLFNTKLTYGHIKGSPKLRKAICKLYSDSIDDVIITNGAIGANFLTLYSIVNPGDKIICVDPTYQQLPSCSQVFSQNKVISWKLEMENDYRPNLNELQKLIKEESPKLLILNNPNNPTGMVFDDSTMREIVKICKEHNVWILCDEVYRPLYQESNSIPDSIINYGYDNTISTSSTSKAFSLAGLRLGWIATKNKSIIENITSKRDYNIISISIIDDILATFAMENYKVILEKNHNLCKKNLAIIDKFVYENKHLQYIKPLGGSVCFIKVDSKFDTMDLCTTLATDYSTLIVPGEVFEKPGFLRIGYGNNTQNIINGLSQLNKYLDTNS